jgi:CheY-like chemotaxis protein
MTCNPIGRSSLQVLVLEDEPLLLMDIQYLLGEMGLASVTACPTVEAAIDAVQKQHFDVALLDVMIGPQTAVALALDLHGRGTAIGFVSGTDGDFLPDGLRSRPLLRKPYTADAFRMFLEQLATERVNRTNGRSAPLLDDSPPGHLDCG